MSLPAELNYDVNLNSIMDGVTTRTHYILPSNGQTFNLGNSGSLVIFDLTSNDYLVPDSLMLTYSYKVSSTGLTQQRAVPYTSIIDRLEVIMGSQSVQTIPQFNQLSNMVTNLTHSVSNKQGLAISHGYKTYNKFVPTTAHADGAVHLINASGNVGGPLRCLLSEASHLIPLVFMPNVRIQLTLASLETVFTAIQDSTILAGETAADANDRVTQLQNGILAQPAVVFPTGFTITNFQLSYNSMTFPSVVTEQLRMSPSPILIKSQGFSTTSQNISVGTSGVVENVYNSRYASIKSLFLINSSISTNGIFDSFNITPSASYQFYINGLQYPPLPITKGKNAYIELLKATGSAFDTVANNYAINANEYNYELGDVTTLSEPAKFYVGVSSEISAFNDRLLSGVSSENSSLSVRMQLEIPTEAVVTSSLVVNYDMIIQIDPMTRSASIKM